jgi:multicomponent K+:H+ antiporter subunit G
MTLLSEIVISVLLVIGGVFGLVGSYGLLKLPDTMSRLHAPTKASTLGIGGVLLASILHFALIEQKYTVEEILVTIFLFITAPISTHFLAKAWLHRNARPEDLPETGTDCGWIGYDLAEPKEAEGTEAD